MAPFGQRPRAENSAGEREIEPSSLSFRGQFDVSPTDMTALIRDARVEGRGLFIDCLEKELTRRGDPVPFLAHDLMGELEGKPSTVSVAP